MTTEFEYLLLFEEHYRFKYNHADNHLIKGLVELELLRRNGFNNEKQISKLQKLIYLSHLNNHQKFLGLAKNNLYSA